MTSTDTGREAVSLVPGSRWATDAVLIGGWPWGWGALSTTNATTPPSKCTDCHRPLRHGGLAFPSGLLEGETVERCADCARSRCKATYRVCALIWPDWLWARPDDVPRET